MNNYFFIGGASGSGKTAIQPILSQIIGEQISIFDFDDIGIPEHADTLWRQQATEKWLKKLLSHKQHACLLGQIVLGELLACPSAVKIKRIHFCLLDVNDIKRVERLKQDFKHNCNQNMLNWSSWLRMHTLNPKWEPQVIKDQAWSRLQFSSWDKLSDWPSNVSTHSIDTTHHTLNEVAQKVKDWIDQCRKKIHTSQDLGLPIFYQDYPEYFENPSIAHQSLEKNIVIEDILKKHDAKTVLDMTCGTGSQVFHLHDCGHQVKGSDFSPGLLEIARKHAANKKVKIQWIDGDMRTLRCGQFDAVITIDNAIGHLIKSDFIIALKNVSANLQPNGLYVFDILNLDALTDSVINADNKRMTKTRTTPDGTSITNKRHSTVDRRYGHFISDNQFSIKKGDEIKKIKNTCVLQIYTMPELKHLLENNGFDVLNQYKADAYTLEPSKSGYSMITVARKNL